MAEYLAPLQNVNLNTPVVMNASIKCTKGYIYHQDGTGIFILRGITNGRFARYNVLFKANIAVPEGGTAGPIAIAITLNGEPIMASRSIATPAAAGDYNVAFCLKDIDVPAGCCFNLAIEPVTAYNDGTTPPQVISLQNGVFTINRTA